MADQDKQTDDPERRPGVLGGAPSLAEEGDIAFGGMAGIAVISAILISMLALSGFFGYNPPPSNAAAPTPTTAAVAEDDHSDDDEDADADHADDDDADDDAEEDAEVDDLVLTPAEATIDATPDGIVLAGTVPSEEIAQQLRDAASAQYTPDQIDDQLVVDDGAEPFTLTVNGALDDGAAVSGLSEGLAAVGADDFTDNLELSEQAGIVAALNDLVELEPILFESGTDVIVADSQATLDEAAEILQSFPDAAVEIGGHTDSRGDDASNQQLSQRRADAVLAALVERGVTNDLTAVGFGETQLKVDPDDTAEAQQENRRIEFTLL